MIMVMMLIVAVLLLTLVMTMMSMKRQGYAKSSIHAVLTAAGIDAGRGWSGRVQGPEQGRRALDTCLQARSGSSTDSGENSWITRLASQGSALSPSN